MDARLPGRRAARPSLGPGHDRGPDPAVGRGVHARPGPSTPSARTGADRAGAAPGPAGPAQRAGRDGPGGPGYTAAGAAGLAVPEVLLWSDDPDKWGSAGLVMRRVDGETIARRILRDASLPRGAAGARRPARRSSRRACTRWRCRRTSRSGAGPARRACGRCWRTFDQASPTLRAGPAGPRRRAGRRPARRCSCTATFGWATSSSGPEGCAAVIDWERVHAGNPAEDLGWLCVKAWRFGAAAPVAGIGTREELLDAYRAAGGADLSLDELRWWEMLGTLRWGVICMAQARAHLSGAYRSVELAAIGRRACEQEWDLLLLLAPDGAARAAAARPRPSGDGLPPRALRAADGERAAGRGARVPHRPGHARHRWAARLPRAGGGQRPGHRGPRAGARPAPATRSRGSPISPASRATSPRSWPWPTPGTSATRRQEPEPGSR